ncbi:MAG: hypothetical protein IKO91_03370 [Oscillospiraceae bacterium]|nr:hypothetical protein [Oscillospiraceae bacterium]
MSWLLASLGVSLALTLVLELLFAFLWGLRGRDLILCILVNVLTNPPVVLCALLWRAYAPGPEWLPVPLLEAGAVLVEGLFYRRNGERVRRPFLFSLCANAFSYGLGLVFNALI